MQRKINTRPARPGPIRRTLAAGARLLAAPVVKALSWVGRFTLTTLHTSGWFSGLGAASWGGRAYADLKAAAFSNPFSWRAFTLIAFQFQSIPWLAYRWTEARNPKTGEMEPKLEELPEHPFARLMKRPSPGVSFARFVADAVDHLTFGGELFLYAPDSELTGSRAGRPVAPADGGKGLRLLRPDRIVRIEREEGEPVRYHYQEDGKLPRPLLAERVRHIYLFEDPERPGRGWPLAAAAARAVDLMRGGEDWQKGIYDNKGKIPGFLTFSGANGAAMEEAHFERTKAEVQAAYRSAEADGLPMLLENMDWKPNGMTVRDADAVRVEQQAARRVAVGYGVMTPLLGDADNMTYDNLQTSLRALLTNTVLPMLDWLLTELSAAYMPMYEAEGAAGGAAYVGAFLDYNADEIAGLEEDKTAAYERAVRAAGRPVLSANEARSMNGWERTDNPLDDVLYVPINMIPASDGGLGLPTEAEKAVKDAAAVDAAKDGHGSSVDDLVLKLTQPEEA